MAGELIITNGDSAGSSLRAAFPGVEVLPWRDILHEGPVPETDSLEELSEIRAAHLAALDWGEEDALIEAFRARDRGLGISGQFDRVTLWFEHDLYDQLQLIQILDWYGLNAEPPDELCLVQTDEFLGRLELEELPAWSERAAIVTSEQISLAERSWAAFRSETPEAWAALEHDDTGALPFLGPAVRRVLEELPDLRSGLTRSEHQALRAIRSGVTRARNLFAAVQSQEEAAFMGDWSFWRLLDGLAGGPRPLIEGLRNGPFRPDWAEDQFLTYLESEIALTELGDDVLAGLEDRAHHARIDLWLGGTHVTNDTLWRWDPRQSTLVAPDQQAA